MKKVVFLGLAALCAYAPAFATFIKVINDTEAPIYVGVTGSPCSSHEAVVLPWTWKTNNSARDEARQAEENAKGVGVTRGEVNWTLDGCDGVVSVTYPNGIEEKQSVRLYSNTIRVTPSYGKKGYEYSYTHR